MTQLAIAWVIDLFVNVLCTKKAIKFCRAGVRTYVCSSNCTYTVRHLWYQSNIFLLSFLRKSLVLLLLLLLLLLDLVCIANRRSSSCPEGRVKASWVWGKSWKREKERENKLGKRISSVVPWFFVLFLSYWPTRDHIGRHTGNSNPVMTSSAGGAKGCSDHRLRARTPCLHCPIGNSASTQSQQPVYRARLIKSSRL